MLKPVLDKLDQLDAIILELERLMVSMKDDELLQYHRRTINLEIATSIAEILDAKAIIYALHPELIPITSSVKHTLYKNYVKKNIPVKNWDISNIDRAKHLQKIFAPSTDDEQLSLF